MRWCARRSVGRAAAPALFHQVAVHPEVSLGVRAEPRLVQRGIGVETQPSEKRRLQAAVCTLFSSTSQVSPGWNRPSYSTFSSFAFENVPFLLGFALQGPEVDSDLAHGVI